MTIEAYQNIIDVTAFFDASFADDIDNRRSIFGYTIQFGHTTILGKSTYTYTYFLWGSIPLSPESGLRLGVDTYTYTYLYLYLYLYLIEAILHN